MPNLATECAYVEGRLKIAAPRPGSTPAERIHAIYGALLEQEEERAGLAAQRDADFPARLATLANGTRRELLKASSRRAKRANLRTVAGRTPLAA